MRSLLLLLTVLAMGAAGPPNLPLGKFQTWFASRRAPLTFTSGGIAVRLAALPCGSGGEAEDTCHVEGFNNQAEVTVSGPGLALVRITTNPQASYARIAVVRLDRRDRRPGVVVESDSGGSAGLVWETVLAPAGRSFVRIDLKQSHPYGVGETELFGEINDNPTDLTGDGATDFVLLDGNFAWKADCNACGPSPPLVLTIRHGRSVNISRDPRLAPIFARDMAARRVTCFSAQPERNGACAAYVADAARLHQFRRAWAEMLRHYNRQDLAGLRRCDVAAAHGCPPGRLSYSTFPAALRASLMRAGYIRR